MATASVTNTFVTGTPAQASQVNQNFTDLVTFLNNQVFHLDGSRALTNELDMGGRRVINLGTPSLSTDAATKAYVDGSLSGIGGVPAGVITAYGGSTAPAGYLLCDGSAVSRSTYSVLFGALGVSFGAGDGVTTFNLPDLRGRFPVGRNASVTAHDVLGETGGSRDAIVVTHNHGISGSTALSGSLSMSGSALTDGVHSHTYTVRQTASYAYNTSSPTTTRGFSTSSDSGGVLTSNSGSHTHSVSVSGASHSHTISATVDNNGSSGTNANLPPYQTVNFIISTGL